MPPDSQHLGGRRALRSWPSATASAESGIPRPLSCRRMPRALWSWPLVLGKPERGQ